MLSLMILKILYLLVFILTANIPYKKAIFNKINFKQTVLLSLIFITSSFFLYVFDYKKINIQLNYFTITTFIAATTLWFIFPKLVRLFGKYPNSYYWFTPKYSKSK